VNREGLSRMPLLSGDDCATTEEREFEFILRPNNDG
jgi:hypothetical protein